MRVAGLLVALLMAAMPLAAQQPQWFSAWASAHNVGRGVAGLNGGAVRLIVRPTLSGQSLRIKFTKIRGNAPAVFAAAFVGVTGRRAAVVPGATASSRSMAPVR